MNSIVVALDMPANQYSPVLYILRGSEPHIFVPLKIFSTEFISTSFEQTISKMTHTMESNSKHSQNYISNKYNNL